LSGFGRLVAVLALGIWSALASPSGRAAASNDPFPEPEALRPAVAFWTRVYLESTTDGGFVHDARHLGVVYELVRYEGERNTRRREAIVNARKEHWADVLDHFAIGGEPRNERERDVRRDLTTALGRVLDAQDFRDAKTRLRFQLGQRDKFREGVIRAGAYEAEMRAHFRERRMPEDLAYLPHVESSFNVHAYSKYGAAGVWQFMRGTGKRFMQVDYVIDERLDPITATDAAARLLRENYGMLGTWPLALTAYNHGGAGMKRAVKQVGTSRIDVIVERYQSPSFGFASRNFYAQFLAARRIMQTHESYFGPLQRDEPRVVDVVALPFYADVSDLERNLGVSRETIAELNPALRPPVFRSGKRIPKGYTLRLPAGTVVGDASTWLAAVPKASRHSNQHQNRYYTVRRGDTLSRIAARNRTTVSALLAENDIGRGHRIYAGQVLQMPDRGGKAAVPKESLELVATAQAATLPKEKPQAAKPATPAPTPAPAPAVAELPVPVPTPAPVAEPEPMPEDVPQSIASTEIEIAPIAEIAATGEPAVATLVMPAAPDDSPFRRIDKERVIVDSDETLGHFAEWLQVSPQRLRTLNKLKPRRQLQAGQKLKLDFSKVTPEVFQQRRLEYHKGIEEDFFGSFRVANTVDHRMRPGETLWLLSHKKYAVPTWLIRRYNPDVDLAKLVPGTVLVIPIVERAT
jgi:membrane-bound lytic murein transglycosylase D